MRTSSVSLIGFASAVVLAAVIFLVGLPVAGWIPTLASGILLLVLLTFDNSPTRTLAQSLTYAAVCGFLFLTAAIYPVHRYVPGISTLSSVAAIAAQPWFPAIWLAGALAFLIVDRFRIGSHPVVLEMRAPVFAAASLPAAVTPVAPNNVQAADSMPEEALLTEQTPSTVHSAADVLPSAASQLATQPVPRGKPATVYLNLIDAGIACLRPVQAEHLGRDFYVIVEPVPEGEVWEFQTGQIVRCRKRSLSSGKALVAYEEAPRVS